jgi:hypothetical protein
MTPLPIDDRRIGKLADACDAIEDEQPRGPNWKARREAAYRALADAADRAARNARQMRNPFAGYSDIPGANGRGNW